MQIAHVIPYFPPANRFGGVPEAVFSLVRAQAQLGHNITVLTTDAGLSDEISRDGLTLKWKPSNTLRASGQIENIRIFYFPNRFPQLATRHKIFTASFWNEDTKILLPSPLDILHLHEVHIPGYRSICQNALSYGAKLCVSCHGSLNPPVHRGIKQLFHKMADSFLRRGWFHKASAYFALCKNEQEQLIHCGADSERIHILPHGRPVFDPPFSELPFPASGTDEIPTFLYLGRINSAKGVMNVVQSFCTLMKKGFLARLICCGPDEGCVDSIQKMCSRHNVPITKEAVLTPAGLYILSPVSPKCIPALFKLADCTVCPSLYEIFGLVPIESIELGVPIIATSVYGCLEHLSAQDNLISIVPPDDPQSLQEYMFKCPIRDKKNPIIPGLDTMLPSWNEAAKKVIEIYKSITPQ